VPFFASRVRFWGVLTVPRTKKAAGTAVDRRNGRRVEIAASAMERLPLPRREPAWLPETRKAWLALWGDPVASVLSPVDRPVLLRWADALDRASRTLAAADLDPVATGSMGQPVENPLYGVADKAVRTAQACEAQLGVGAMNRARLGLAVLAERASLMDLNARLMEGMDDDPDPRLG
jgi:hypothetical protein